MKVLQDNIKRLDDSENLESRGDFISEGGDPDGKVFFVADPNGKCTIPSLPRPDKQNLVLDNGKHMGANRFSPMNDLMFCMGTDPINYGATASGKGSTPVVHVKRKYDSVLEGVNTPELMRQRKEDRYQYKTGIPACRYAYRPTDPYIYYDYVIRICRFYGCKIHIERNAGMGLIRYMEERGYSDFIMYRPEITRTSARSDQATQGSATSKQHTQFATSITARDIEYFGHCYFSKEMTEDLLAFDPNNTVDHDDTMAWNFCNLAEHAEAEMAYDSEMDLTALNRWGKR